MSNRVVVTQASMRAKFHDKDMQDALDDTTRDIVEAIKDESPVKSGYYQDSIRSRRFPISRRVYSIDIAAPIIEYGGANVKGPGGGPAIVYAPFRRAVRRLRLIFKPTPKPGHADG